MKKKRALTKKNADLIKQINKDNIHYKFFIGIIIANLVYYLFFEHKIIGNDSRYNIYVFWIPNVLGLFITSRYYIFKEIWSDFFISFKTEKFFLFVYSSVLILLGNLVFTYLIFGFSANLIWNYVNKTESEKNRLETLHLPIIYFKESSGRSGKNLVSFEFKGSRENINISYNNIKPYLNKNPDDYQLILEVREGIWNYYTIENWNIINK